ncbi:MAG: hypothetical protein RSA40_02340 [Malacoplasma sp.]
MSNNDKGKLTDLSNQTPISFNDRPLTPINVTMDSNRMPTPPISPQANSNRMPIPPIKPVMTFTRPPTPPIKPVMTFTRPPTPPIRPSMNFNRMPTPPIRPGMNSARPPMSLNGQLMRPNQMPISANVRRPIGFNWEPLNPTPPNVPINSNRGSTFLVEPQIDSNSNNSPTSLTGVSSVYTNERLRSFFPDPINHNEKSIDLSRAPANLVRVSSTSASEDAINSIMITTDNNTKQVDLFKYINDIEIKLRESVKIPSDLIPLLSANTNAKPIERIEPRIDNVQHPIGFDEKVPSSNAKWLDPNIPMTDFNSISSYYWYDDSMPRSKYRPWYKNKDYVIALSLVIGAGVIAAGVSIPIVVSIQNAAKISELNKVVNVYNLVDKTAKLIVEGNNLPTDMAMYSIFNITTATNAIPIDQKSIELKKISDKEINFNFVDNTITANSIYQVKIHNDLKTGNEVSSSTQQSITQPSFSITRQSESKIIKPTDKQSLTLSVTISAINNKIDQVEPTYQWKTAKSNSTFEYDWTLIPNQTKSAYEFNATEIPNLSKQYFKCIVNYKYANPVTSIPIYVEKTDRTTI